MQHLFLMDPIAKLNLELDTSLRLANTFASKYGHEIFCCDSHDLLWDSIHEPAAVVRRLTFQGQSQLTALALEKEEMRSLSSFQCIHMRKDPPFNIDYVLTTLFLDAAAAKKTFVINHPRALKEVNEKLSTLKFARYCKPSLVSARTEDIISYIKEHCAGDAVVKPLTLFGGKGISRLQFKEKQMLDELVRQVEGLTNGGKEVRQIQAFDKRVLDGEVRAFCVMARPIAWCLKKPKPGEYLANSNFGSTRHAYSPNPTIEKKVMDLALELLGRGIYVVGFDIIGDEITEINVTSPRLLFADENPQPYFDTFAALVINAQQEFSH